MDDRDKRYQSEELAREKKALIKDSIRKSLNQVETEIKKLYEIVETGLSSEMSGQVELLLEIVQSLKLQLNQEEHRDKTQALKDAIEKLEGELKELEFDREANPSHPEGAGGKQMIEEMNEEHREMTDWAFDHLDGLYPGTILDVGCGGGAAIKNLHQRFPEAVIEGIDISDVSVLKSIEYNKEDVIAGIVRIIQGNVEDLPYSDDYFNLTVSISSYFFWPDFDRALKEIRRTLKPGGTLLLISAIHKELEYDDGDFVSLPYVHNFLTVEDFESKLAEMGFEDVCIYTREDNRWICARAKK